MPKQVSFWGMCVDKATKHLSCLWQCLVRAKESDSQSLVSLTSSLFTWLVGFPFSKNSRRFGSAGADFGKNKKKFRDGRRICWAPRNRMAKTIRYRIVLSVPSEGNRNRRLRFVQPPRKAFYRITVCCMHKISSESSVTFSMKKSKNLACWSLVLEVLQKQTNKRTGSIQTSWFAELRTPLTIHLDRLCFLVRYSSLVNVALSLMNDFYFSLFKSQVHVLFPRLRNRQISWPLGERDLRVHRLQGAVV